MITSIIRPGDVTRAAMAARSTKLLFTPGPLTTSASVRADMARTDLGSRDNEFIALQKEVRAGLLRVGGVSESHECIILQGSGTYAVEAAVGCSVKPGGKALVISNGAYGDRIADICTRLRIDHNVVSASWDDVVSPQAVKEELAQRPVDVVFMVHHETTCGIINDVPGIQAVLPRNTVLVVDSMSGFGALPLDCSDIDFVVSSANKCIPGVPGFAFVLAKRESLLATKGNARSLVLDILAQWEGLDKTGQFRFTPPTHSMVAFATALRMHETRGGSKANLERFTQNHHIIKEGMKELGFHTFVRPEIQSPIITAFRYPRLDWDWDKFYDAMNQLGFVLYPGKMKDMKAFRVGNIGEIFPEDCRRFVAAASKYVQQEQQEQQQQQQQLSLVGEIKASAQVLVSSNPPVFQERHISSVDPTEGLVRVLSATICASDLHSASGRRLPCRGFGPDTACTLGHEGFGVLLRPPSSSPLCNASTGDVVCWAVAASCTTATCRPCAKGLPQKCTEIYKYGHEPYGPGTELSGSYATHVALRPGTAIARLCGPSEPLPAPQALCSVIACAGATAVAVVRAARGVAGKRVLVFGGGSLGLLTAIAARDAAAESVTVVDPAPERAAAASALGFHTEVSGEYEVCIEACGAVQAIPQAVSALEVGGVLVIAGLVHPQSQLTQVTGEQLIRKCLTLVGVHNYTPHDLADAALLFPAPKHLHSATVASTTELC